ncbi:hypothetical protein TSMEX_009596 [Taenia solium]|eukprot:TsM_001032500 transcript=TsM_001032500 gene=TsM_001032500
MAEVVILDNRMNLFTTRRLFYTLIGNVTDSCADTDSLLEDDEGAVTGLKECVELVPSNAALSGDGEVAGSLTQTCCLNCRQSGYRSGQEVGGVNKTF